MVGLLRDPAPARRLGDAARRRVQEACDWRRIAATWCAAPDDVCAGRARGYPDTQRLDLFGRGSRTMHLQIAGELPAPLVAAHLASEAGRYGFAGDMLYAAPRSPS